MAVGQSAFWVAADVAALDDLEVRLALREVGRGATHAGMIRDVLDLHAVYARRGMTVSTVPHAALAMGCSEQRAGRLLAEGQALASLPGALEAVECGLLTVEQSGVLVSQFAPLTPRVRLEVWRRLQARLCEQGVLPPARLSELLRRWIIAADRDAAEERRRAAEADRRVEYRRRDDGLHDLSALGFRGPDMQAILSRIAARSASVSVWDERTADQRRFDALKDLLLGREGLPLDHEPCAGGCGCRPGARTPCGVEVLVHMRWEAGLGTSDEPAELVGHGPIEPDLLQELLLAAPRLRAVWTDEFGVPIAVDDRLVVPQRGDVAALRQALLDLARRPPPERRPRSPVDHPPPEGKGRAAHPDEAPPEQDGSDRRHAEDAPGTYRPPRRIRRLIRARAPRCEWPGCGARAERCDDEHDLAWPFGPTCACNLGPCCRHHHRVKQCGWIKTRHANGSLSWTSPTGRSWLSAAQHEAPQPATRPLPANPSRDPLADLSPGQLEEELWSLGLLPDDDLETHRPPADEDTPDGDRLGHRLVHGDTRWTLDIEDPYVWLDDAGRSAP